MYFLLSLPAIPLKAFVFLKLYTWFLVPMGAPLIYSWRHALGLIMIIGFMSFDSSTSMSMVLDEMENPERTKKRKQLSLVNTYLVPLTFWLFGALYYYLSVNGI